MDFIENYEGYIDEMEFFKHACEVGMYDVARRSAYILMRLIDRHNNFIHNIEFYENEKSRF